MVAHREHRSPFWALPKEVLLIYPFTGIDVPGVSVFLPLSVLSLSSGLEAAGFRTCVLDMRVDPRWRRTLGEAMQRKPLYVGISAMTGKQIYWGLKAARLVRRADPVIPIVWGGTMRVCCPKRV